MPFLFYGNARWRFGAKQQKMSQMKEKEDKTKYERPNVVVKSVAVENGMQLSGHPDESSNVSTSQYGSASWDN